MFWRNLRVHLHHGQHHHHHFAMVYNSSYYGTSDYKYVLFLGRSQHTWFSVVFSLLKSPSSSLDFWPWEARMSLRPRKRQVFRRRRPQAAWCFGSMVDVYREYYYGWWGVQSDLYCLVVWNIIFLVSIDWEFYHSNWKTHIFRRCFSTTHQIGWYCLKLLMASMFYS